MRLYFLTSPSHRILRDTWLLPTLRDVFELVEEEIPQICASGEYMEGGWKEAMLQKCDLVLRAIRENPGGLFLYADVDIQFFKGVEEEIRSQMDASDLLIQQNDPSGRLCPGFFACRGSDRMDALWKRVRDAVASGEYPCDQSALNHVVHEELHRSVRWKLLPPSFFCGGLLTGRRWLPGDPLDVPENILLHHANWTVGLEAKLAQLMYVRRAVNGRVSRQSQSVPLISC